jgi:hypothetical protein
MTKSSPVASIKSLSLWLESTSKESFKDSESEDGLSIGTWYSISPNSTSKFSLTQNTNGYKPIYVSNAINNLPAIKLDGSDDYLIGNSYATHATSITNNFSIFAVAQATSTHEIDSEANSGAAGTSGQKFLMPAIQVADTNFAGAGISMGTNGISFYELSTGYMPPLLVYQATLLKPLVLLMEYNNKTPTLYINGTAVRTGLTSSKIVMSPKMIGNDVPIYGVMSGYVGEVIIFNEVLKKSDRDYVNDYLKKKWGIK